MGMVEAQGLKALPVANHFFIHLCVYANRTHEYWRSPSHTHTTLSLSNSNFCPASHGG